jgi:hypothetical protein
MQGASDTPDSDALPFVLLDQRPKLLDGFMRRSLDFDVHRHIRELFEDVFQQGNA